MTVEQRRIAVTDLMKLYLDKRVTESQFIARLKVLENRKKDGKSYWFRFYKGDTLATTSWDIAEDFKYSHIRDHNYDFLMQRMKYAVENDSLQIYYS